MIKEKLLSCGEFIDNEYLDKYIALIEKNRFTKKQAFRTQRHHIIPRSYFKYKNIELDDSNENQVNLFYMDHVLAHFYLSLCTRGKYKYANQNAVLHVLGNKNYLQSAVYEEERNIILAMPEWQANFEDMMQTRSKMYTGRHCKPNTEKHKQQISAKNTGVIYVRKYINDKWISIKTHSIDEFNKYISEGWEKGNIPRSACKSNVSKNISTAKKDKICINDGKVNKYINKEDLSNYIQNGWQLGGHKLHIRKRIKIKKLGAFLDIYEDELYNYIRKGWEVANDN